jgi:predicted nucleic acid-binding protein
VSGLVVDTSALLAYFDTSEPDHVAVADVLDTATDLLIVSPYVLAELDYLLAPRHGVDAELAVLDELTGGAWELTSISVDELREARSVIRTYRNQHIGVADSSNVIFAQRYRTRTMVTLDHRHFDVLRTTDGQWFTVLPGSPH